MRIFKTPVWAKITELLPVFIIAIGIALRIVVYLQNRSLIIDEANIARNIYERGFAALAQPLDYQQYAPPIFLWILEACTQVFGYSEYVFRLFPFLTASLTLLLMYNLLKHFVHRSSMWHVLFLMATGAIYIRYATEVKQYASDMLVALILIRLTLGRSFPEEKLSGFVITWLLAGSLAIWLSMPSVFILVAVVSYYGYGLIVTGRYRGIGILGLISAVWALQFLVYYFIMLKPQIHSDYLQNWHQQYFLNLLPFTRDNWQKNWNVAISVLENAGGHWTLSVIFHLVMFWIGAVWFLRKDAGKAILLLLPLVLVYIAAAMHQYTLIPRVMLFSMPLMLILIAKGIDVVLHRSNLVVNGAVVIVSAICIINYNRIDLFVNRMQNEEMNLSMDYLQKNHISAGQLYIDDIAVPAYLYYTTIHPAKEKRASIAGANLLHWNTDYGALAASAGDTAAFLHSYIHDPEKHHELTSKMDEYYQIVSGFDSLHAHVLIYKKK